MAQEEELRVQEQIKTLGPKGLLEKEQLLNKAMEHNGVCHILLFLFCFNFTFSSFIIPITDTMYVTFKQHKLEKHTTKKTEDFRCHWELNSAFSCYFNITYTNNLTMEFLFKSMYFSLLHMYFLNR